MRIVALASIGSNMNLVAHVPRNTADSNDNPDQIRLDGNYAILSSGLTGVKIFDVSDPAHPLQVSSIAMNGGAEIVNVQVDGSYLFAAQKNYGAGVYNISDPAHPTGQCQCDSNTDHTPCYSAACCLW